MASSSQHRHDHASPERTEPAQRTLERAATWLSLACAVHCLLVPVAVSVLPLFSASGVAALGPGTELVLTLLVVGSAVAGLVWGYRRHGDVRVVYATTAGLAAYLLGHLLEHSWFGVVLAVSGALVLAASSFLSARLSHSCHDATCAH